MDPREDLTGADRDRAERNSVVVPVCGPLPAAETGRLCAHVHALLQADRTRDVVCDVQGTPDLTVVDALARLHLTARRLSAELRVRSAGPELAELLTLTGLHGTVPGAGGPATSEPGGQPEAGEQRGVEEVVDVHDLPG